MSYFLCNIFRAHFNSDQSPFKCSMDTCDQWLQNQHSCRTYSVLSIAVSRVHTQMHLCQLLSPPLFIEGHQPMSEYMGQHLSLRQVCSIKQNKVHNLLNHFPMHSYLVCFFSISNKAAKNILYTKPMCICVLPRHRVVGMELLCQRM